MSKEKFFAMDGSDLRHITKDGVKPVCGVKNQYLQKQFEIAYPHGDLELKEFFTCEVQGSKWMIVQHYNYCKRCIKILRKASGLKPR